MNFYLALVEKEIKSQKFGKQPLSLYDPIRYIMSLGGKRLRPLLVLSAYSLYKENVKDIVPYAAAVEAFHNFTLMHDDIMDKAPLRRGKQTVHKKWNVNTAILSGDVMLVKVYDMFLSLEGEKLKEVLKAFNRCAAEVCEGQQWDMEFETTDQVLESQYINMIRLKTAVLLGFSLELGAILADASDADRKALREFGVNIGIGFQLKDDLLDAYADPEKFGKQVGGDIIANKKTILLIHALRKSKGQEAKQLSQWLNTTKFNKAEKVRAVKNIYDSIGIQKTVKKKIDQYFEKGFRSLETIAPSSQKEFLIEFTKSLIEREV
jgi:geranylgeranyl diphosphate synthase, type II